MYTHQNTKPYCSVSPFVQAMDSFHSRISGENGSTELVSTSDPRVDLFFGLVRNIPDHRVSQLVSKVLELSGTAMASPKQQLSVDLIVMAFQTRDSRGGKGERLLFAKLFALLAEHYQTCP